MNNNFWFLFTQSISQIIKTYEGTNKIIKNWEWHFQKLQYGQSLDEDNQNTIKNSENENCNKKLKQNDVGSSHNKSNNKQKTHSLDKWAKNMVKRIQAIPKYKKKKKRWTFRNTLMLMKFHKKHLI